MKVEKSKNFEGWLLLLTNYQPQEFKVAASYQKKYVMLFDKIMMVFDEDKFHLRKPLLVLNFDLHGFYVDSGEKKSLEFR